ncbi:winged helix-turn-helix domain-containing protein [Streptomyces sp. NPDC051173]|uniref:winged helix-turn-helix domain-containing protein n=1 Tax=Streptomyces sp. NPDC051173 TaxID=3155164 RepID=UPI00344EF3AF
MAHEHGTPPRVVDPAKIAYVYAQVADHIVAQIEADALRVGARLPGERDLAEECGVAIGTIRRAVQELRDRGLLITLPAKGTFVAAKPSGAEDADAS